MDKKEIIINVVEFNQPSEQALRDFNQHFLNFIHKMEDGKFLAAEDE